MVSSVRMPRPAARLQLFATLLILALAMIALGAAFLPATGAQKDDALLRDIEKCRNGDNRSSPFPDETNTGVPKGEKLTRYAGTYHINTDDTVVSNLEVEGDIVVEAKNVTIRNTRLISRTPWHALRIMDDVTGLTVVDSEIDGSGTTDNGIYGLATILRVNIHDTENGMTIWGPSLVCDSFVHGLRNTDVDPHFDGIQINGGHDIQIVHNTVINDYGQTSAIIMGNTFAGLSNIVIDGNRLAGGGYVVYLDGRKGGGPVDDATIRITNNRLEGGEWGSFALYDQKPVLSCNTEVPARSSAGTTDLTGCR